MPDKPLKVMRRDKKGVTGLETVIILLAAFVLVAAVFAYITVSAGLFSAQKSQEAVYSGLKDVRNIMGPARSVAASVLSELDDCEDSWNAGINENTARDFTSYVEGTASANFAVAEGFASGLVGYKDIMSDTSTLDLSDYSSVTFWIKSSVNIGDGVLQLRLGGSTDEMGNTAILDIPGSALNGKNWQKVTLNLSDTATDYDAVRSLVLYAVSDPGTVNIWLDIIESRSVLSTGNPVKTRAGELVFNVGGMLGQIAS